jgi:hypothetical protein
MINIFNRSQKIIYFHIDEYYRDAITASVIRQEIKKRNWKIVYGNRITSRLLKYFEWIFDVVILPKPTFLNSYFSYHEIPKLKSKYVMLYTENIGIIANDKFPKMVEKGALDVEYMSGNKNCVEKVSALCFWGSQVADLIVKSYPELAHKCFVVGHPRHDKRAINNLKEQDVVKTVGIVSRYCTLNDYYGRNPIDILIQRYTADDLYEYKNEGTGDFLPWKRRGERVDSDLFIEAMDVKNTILLIRSLSRHGLIVSLKIHPRENYRTWKNVLKNSNLSFELAPSEMPFSEWALKQHCVIGPPSTSFYDSLMLGVLPISIAGLEDNRSIFVSDMYEEFNRLMPHIQTPKSIDEILNIVAITKEGRFKLTPEIEKVLQLEANYPACQNSIKEFGSVLDQVLIENAKKYRALNIVLYIFSVHLLNTIALIKNIFNDKSNSALFILTPRTVAAINVMANNKT